MTSTFRAIPPKAVDFCAKWEGLELAAYRDVVGVWTIGYGHTGPEVVAGLKIDKTKARAMLAQDLGTAAERLEARVGAAVIADLAPCQYAALLSFVFNLGANPSWTIWKLLKARQLDQVPAQIMRFVNAGGHYVPGLAARRAEEVALWHQADAASDRVAPPSSVTRSTPTPPVASDPKPLLQSKSFVTTAAGGVATATVAVGEVSKAVSPFADRSELVAHVLSTLAVIAAVLAVAGLVLIYLKRKAQR